jgi:hypothetical protein
MYVTLLKQAYCHQNFVYHTSIFFGVIYNCFLVLFLLFIFLIFIFLKPHFAFFLLFKNVVFLHMLNRQHVVYQPTSLE